MSLPNDEFLVVTKEDQSYEIRELRLELADVKVLEAKRRGQLADAQADAAAARNAMERLEAENEALRQELAR